MTLTPETMLDAIIANLEPNEVQALSDNLREWLGEQVTSPQLYNLIVRHLEPWQVSTLADSLREYVWSRYLGHRERPA